MIIIVDDREIVTNGYETGFGREGVTTTGFCPPDFCEWVASANDKDFAAVEAFLIGNCKDHHILPKIIRNRSQAPMIALNDGNGLDSILELFASGVDDVVRKPVHVREILARVQAIRRRIDLENEDDPYEAGELRVFVDGRDPEVKGESMVLPRRERRILEHLVQHKGKRVSKQQIFHAVYGLFDEDVDESVVESHISKLRKKLRTKLGYDPIESKRYMGYRLMTISV